MISGLHCVRTCFQISCEFSESIPLMLYTVRQPIEILCITNTDNKPNNWPVLYRKMQL